MAKKTVKRRSVRQARAKRAAAKRARLKKTIPEQQVMQAGYRNQQLFSDYYLANTLPQRTDWQALALQAEPVMAKLAAIFKKYHPSENEPQTEDGFVKPVLQALGHTFEIQAPLATADGTKKPDYIFYCDEDALNANKGKRLDDKLLQGGAFAVGDAKHWDRPLDITTKKSGTDPFTNKNPSYQIAFYMQHSGVAWGILTNGRLWRLYHKATAHKLDHFYEIDLPLLLQHSDREQFLYFYAFFCRSAFDDHSLGVAAILKESIDYAQGVGESLEEQVYDALCSIAQGFLNYPMNELSSDDPLTLKEIYDNSLILLYRLLFIFYAEARDLLPMSESALYREQYSLRSLTRQVAVDVDMDRTLRPNSARLNRALKELFSFINVGDPPLKISTFNGGLFDPHKHPFLEQYNVGDAYLQQALDLLARVDEQFIDYRDLSVRDLGTIYEGLLEYHLEKVEAEAEDDWAIDLLSDKGEERKATGSYYTPDYIVKYIIEQTLGPVLQVAVDGSPDEKKQIEAVLALKVLDPSMGSGHFLVEATEYIARFIVEHIAPSETTQETDLAYWKRRVVQSCIYGVDLNPLAVELAKLSLWLNTVAKDRPLSFLDHHLRTGNALLGARLADFTVAPNGNGNGKPRKVKDAEAPKAQLALFDDETFRQSMTTAVDLMWLVESKPSETVAQVKEQEQLYTGLRNELTGKYGRLADLTMAVHYEVTVDPFLWKPLVDFATGHTLMIPTEFIEWLEIAADLTTQHRFFHWELEFPEIFFDRYGQPKHEQAGFDVVVGNPPWIRQETFSEDKPALKHLYQVYHGAADLSTYFMELGNTYLRENGRFGFIVPNKFVRANYGETLRTFLTSQVRLERLVDFGDLPVFTEAVTYPMIVLTVKRSLELGEGQPQQVKYTLLKKLDTGALADTITNEETLLSWPVSTGTWLLNGEKTHALLEKLRAISVPLGDYVGDKILYGIKTGFNEAFVIDRLTRDRLIAEDARSAEIIKPFVVGRDIKRYSVSTEERYIILTKIGTPIERYPAAFTHLQRYQPQLEARWDKGQHWWELRACDYYAEFEKPKIIFPDIADGCTFAFDTTGVYSANTTYFMPVDPDQKYVVALLNSSLLEFFFREISALIRGGYLRFFTQYVAQIPIRRITFATAPAERSAQTNQGMELYNVGKHEEVLFLIERCLASQPEQVDVVRDVLAFLAEQMIDLNRQRQQAVEDFMLGLEGVLSDAQLQKLNRLWTPPMATQADNEDAEMRLTEAQEKLGALAIRSLELRDDIGMLSEEQWKWLLKQRLSKPDLVHLTKVYRTFQPAIATLDRHISATDHLIDQLVYRLYGLTSEEIALVEGKR